MSSAGAASALAWGAAIGTLGGLTGIGAPMAAGSVLGAMAGAALLPVVPVGALELVLGAILVVSSVTLWRKGAAKVAAARAASGS